MDVVSTYKYARVSPKKARDVAREIQGLPVSDALDILTFTPKKAAFLINKTLKSAVANAENNFELDADTLIVGEATIGEGPAFKRFKPRARGSAGAIRKRTSNIRIVLRENEEEEVEAAPKKKAAKKPAAAAPKEEAAPVTEDSALANRGQIYEVAPDVVDDLKVISGVGPAIEEKLNNYGIYTYAQIAAWTPENVEAFDALLSFKGRIDRDDWIKQATDLAAGTSEDA